MQPHSNITKSIGIMFGISAAAGLMHYYTFYLLIEWLFNSKATQEGGGISGIILGLLFAAAFTYIISAALIILFGVIIGLLGSKLRVSKARASSILAVCILIVLSYISINSGELQSLGLHVATICGVYTFSLILVNALSRQN